MSRKAVKLIVTLVIGICGALLATWLKLPAAALVGATAAVSAGSLLRLTVNIPDTLRNLAFVVVGCTLGSGITNDIFSQAVRWPASLLILSVAILSTLCLSSWVLVHVFHERQDIALLSTIGSDVFPVPATVDKAEFSHRDPYKIKIPEGQSKNFASTANCD